MMFQKHMSVEAAEAGLEDVLKNFRSSVHAWSEAEFVRPRTVPFAEHRRTWRQAAAWALGCALAAGSLSAGMYEHSHRGQLARMATEHAAARRAAEQQLAAKQDASQDDASQDDASQDDASQDLNHAVDRGTASAATARTEDEKLMAAVDKDVSQEVPSAMEPLAQLMDEGANQ